MRMTKNKQKILEALRPVSYAEAFESGQAPFSASDVAKKLNINLSNVSRTLKNMERQGLVVMEERKKEVWYAPKEFQCGSVLKLLKCYWNSEHIDEDRKAEEEYLRQKNEQSQNTWLSFDELFED